jgi:hypothetical protein
MDALQTKIEKINALWQLGLFLGKGDNEDEVRILRKDAVILGSMSPESAFLFLCGVDQGLRLDFKRRSEMQIKWIEQWNRSTPPASV